MVVLRMSLTGSLFIVFVLVLRKLSINRLPKRVFVLMWMFTVAKLLVPLSIPSGLNIVSLISNWFTPKVQYNLTMLMPLNHQVEPMTLVAHSIGSLIWLFRFGLIVSALLLGRGIIAHLKARHVYKTAIPVRKGMVLSWSEQHQIPVKVLDRISSPLTYGIIKPVILLPKCMLTCSEEEIGLILLHEWIHIKRKDTLRKLLIMIAVCLHWFNPLVWLFAVVANRDIELSCDEEVIRQKGYQCRKTYATLLVNVSAQALPLSLSASFNGTFIQERILSMMKIKQKNRLSTVITLSVIAGTTLLFVATPTLANKQIETGQSSVVLHNKEDNLYSEDAGKTWLSADKFDKDVANVEWWTVSEYQKWLEVEKIELKQLIGEKFRDSEINEWRVFTKKDYRQWIEGYEESLGELKKGNSLSKSVDGQENQQLAYSEADSSYDEATESEFMIQLTNGQSQTFKGKTQAERQQKLVNFCLKAIKDGKMTTAEYQQILSDVTN